MTDRHLKCAICRNPLEDHMESCPRFVPTPPLASVRARKLLTDEYMRDGEAGLARLLNGPGGETGLHFGPALRAIDTATNQLLDEIEGRVKGLKVKQAAPSRYAETHNAAIDEALAAIKELRHGRS